MKNVFVVDDDVDIYNPDDVDWALATRFQGDKDVTIKAGEKGSSLDPSSNLETRETTKVGFDLTVPLEKNKEDFVRAEVPMNLNPKEYL